MQVSDQVSGVAILFIFTIFPNSVGSVLRAQMLWNFSKNRQTGKVSLEHICFCFQGGLPVGRIEHKLPA